MSEPINNPAPVAGDPTPVKTFTQEEVDAIVGRKLAKVTKGMPNEEDLKAFRTWQDSQKTERERWENLNKENEANKAALAQAQAEIEQNRREKFLTSKGISSDDVDYYAYKIGKMVTDELTFEKAAEKFLSDKKPAATMRVNFTAPVGGGKPAMNASEAMNALIRGAIK